MVVSLQELREATTRIFDHLEKTGVRQIEVDHDYYWMIAEEQRYDPTKKPTDFALGQLSDDLNELRQIAAGEETVSFALVWLGAVLRAVGEKVVR